MREGADDTKLKHCVAANVRDGLDSGRVDGTAEKQTLLLASSSSAVDACKDCWMLAKGCRLMTCKAKAPAGGSQVGSRQRDPPDSASRWAAATHLMYTVPALQPLGCGAKPLRGDMGQGVPSFQAAA